VEVQNENDLETFFVSILYRFMALILTQDPRYRKYKKYKNIDNFCAEDVWMNLKKHKIQLSSRNSTHSLCTYNTKDQICTLLIKIYTAFVNSNRPTNTEYCCNMRIQLDKKENSYHTTVCWVLKKLDLDM
jgi:hypothetical protein